MADDEVEEPTSVTSNEKCYLTLSPEFYDEFCSCDSDQERWMATCKASCLDFYIDNSKSEIIQEYLFHNLHFCHENGMSFDQAKGVMSIAESYLQRCAMDSSIATEAAAIYFREQVDSVILSNGSSSKLDVPVLQKFLKFFANSFVRHLELYQEVFGSIQKEEVTPTLLSVQTPFIFPSLMSCEDSGKDVEATEEPEEEYDNENFEPLTGRSKS